MPTRVSMSSDPWKASSVALDAADALARLADACLKHAAHHPLLQSSSQAAMAEQDTSGRSFLLNLLSTFTRTFSKRGGAPSIAFTESSFTTTESSLSEVSQYVSMLGIVRNRPSSVPLCPVHKNNRAQRSPPPPPRSPRPPSSSARCSRPSSRWRSDAVRRTSPRMGSSLRWWVRRPIRIYREAITHQPANQHTTVRLPHADAGGAGGVVRAPPLKAAPEAVRPLRPEREARGVGSGDARARPAAHPLPCGVGRGCAGNRGAAAGGGRGGVKKREASHGVCACVCVCLCIGISTDRKAKIG